MEQEKEFTFKSSRLPGTSYEYFKEVKMNKEFCDITFRVGDKSIEAHRIIIAASIPYFRNTLSSKALQSEEIEVDFPDVEPRAFESLIEFAYTCEVIISTENVRDLLHGACQLYIAQVSEACCDFILDRLQPDDVLCIRDFTCQLQCSELIEHADHYVRENFAEISKQEEFLDLPFAYVKKLFSSDDLHVDSEEETFEAAMEWIKKCPEERKVYLPDMLKTVRMSCLSSLYLRSHVAKEDLIRNSIPCRDLLDEVRDFHTSPEERSGSCSFSTTTRYSLKCSGVGDSSNANRMYAVCWTNAFAAKCFSGSEDMWKSAAPSCSFNHESSSSAEFNNEIYHFQAPAVVKYDPLNNTGEFLTKIRSPRKYTAAVALGNKIYVIGGITDSQASNAVDCYDPKQNKWETVNCMRERRSSPGVVKFGESIYVLGGIRTTVYNSVEKFDPRSGKWRSAPSMLTGRCAFHPATLNGRIYACGGMTSDLKCIATAEVYDPDEKKWKFISPMNTTRRFSKLLAYRGKLHALGGSDDAGNRIDTVEIYDPQTDQWTFGSALNSTYPVAGAAVIYSSAFSEN